MFIPESRNNVDRVRQELDEPEYNHFFVKKVVTRALDKHNHEREMASILLFALLGEVCFPLTKAAVYRFLQCLSPGLKVINSTSLVSLFAVRHMLNADRITGIRVKGSIA
jgi:hypothetical protein